MTVSWSGASAAMRSSPGSRSIGSPTPSGHRSTLMPRRPGGGEVTVPTGVTIFPKDLVPAPREFAERFFPIIRWAELPRGGHFTAWEEPEAFARELTALAQECGRC